MGSPAAGRPGRARPTLRQPGLALSSWEVSVDEAEPEDDAAGLGGDDLRPGPGHYRRAEPPVLKVEMGPLTTMIATRDSTISITTRAKARTSAITAYAVQGRDCSPLSLGSPRAPAGSP